jgi:hypothetical protein
MKVLLLIGVAVAAGISLVPQASARQSACDHTAIRAEVEVASGEFFLSDLLEPSAAPALVQAAGRVRLGSAPLAGSVRVMEGASIRALLETLSFETLNDDNLESTTACGSIRVPERIRIHRAGTRRSCSDLIEQIRATLPEPVPAVLLADHVDCGAAGRIPENAPIELLRTTWNPRLESWEIRARCVHPADCVPFLLSLRGSRMGLQTASLRQNESGSIQSAGSSLVPGRRTSGLNAEMVVRPGQLVTLIWDQNGIRVSVPVLCLDAGGPGQQIRARIVRGGTVVRAIVESAQSLRAVS